MRRFDEIFFVDLPFQREREEIFRIHLSKRHRDPRDFNLELLATNTDGFSGAEIEQIIISSLYDTLSDEVPFNTDLILKNTKEIIPLSVSMKEKIDNLREIAMNRFRMASVEPSLPVFSELDLRGIFRKD
ncbi:MAG: proteasome-activating nucleotidase [bacterium ADurb.Bin363]|nr:MAG: proteasome-activating nucleotidase [bacterium ADurb.Bin363]